MSWPIFFSVNTVLAICNNVVIRLLPDTKICSSYSNFVVGVFDVLSCLQILASGQSIVNRRDQSTEIRPLARQTILAIGAVREALTRQALVCLTDYSPETTNVLSWFDHVWVQYEYKYVLVMFACLLCFCLCISRCVYLFLFCLSVCMSIHLCLSVCMYICMYVCCMYVCLCLCCLSVFLCVCLSVCVSVNTYSSSVILGMCNLSQTTVNHIYFCAPRCW